MGEPLLPIVAEIAIEAPMEQVWDVLTGEASVPAWLGALDYRAEVGSTFFMQHDAERRAVGDTEGATWCEVLALQKPHKFDFSWYVPGTPQTLVQISVFSEGEKKSFVRLIHDGWDEFPREAAEGFYNQLAAGWREQVLPGLRRACEAAG